MSSKNTGTDSPSGKHYLHPYLVALFPAANLYVANWTAVDLKDLLLPSVVVLTIAFVVYAIARSFCSDFEKAAVLASWTLAWFFSFALLRGLMNFAYRQYLSGLADVRGEFLLAAWGMVWLAGMIGIVKSSRPFKPVNAFLTPTVAMLIAISFVLLGFHWCYQDDTQNAGPSDSWIQPIAGMQKPRRYRDIYYLVFDRYGGAETLKRKFQLDNDSFLEQLRSRGFQVSGKSCANYPRTILSICSTLNLSYLPDESKSDRYYSQLIDNHLVGRSLKELGYEYHHMGNWYQPLRSNRNASKVYPTSFLPSEYAETLYAVTPLSKAFKGYDKYEFVVNQFHDVSATAQYDAPTFVYAHFLIPHPPYVLDRDGSQIPWVDSRYGDPKEGYQRQLEGTNQLILKTVDEILKRSDPRPIIVLQADEGPYLSEDDLAISHKQQILTRSSILNAFLLPKPDSATEEIVVSESLSPVNTFRLIFREYFNADVDLLPDRTFYWNQADPKGRPAEDNKRYVDVTSLIAE